MPGSVGFIFLILPILAPRWFFLVFFWLNLGSTAPNYFTRPLTRSSKAPPNQKNRGQVLPHPSEPSLGASEAQRSSGVFRHFRDTLLPSPDMQNEIGVCRKNSRLSPKSVGLWWEFINNLADMQDLWFWLSSFINTGFPCRKQTCLDYNLLLIISSTYLCLESFIKTLPPPPMEQFLQGYSSNCCRRFRAVGALNEWITYSPSHHSTPVIREIFGHDRLRS